MSTFIFTMVPENWLEMSLPIYNQKYLFPFFVFYCYAAHRDLHSFPTRRSSDLDFGARRWHCPLRLEWVWSRRNPGKSARSRVPRSIAPQKQSENAISRRRMEMRSTLETESEIGRAHV